MREKQNEQMLIHVRPSEHAAWKAAALAADMTKTAWVRKVLNAATDYKTRAWLEIEPGEKFEVPAPVPKLVCPGINAPPILPPAPLPNPYPNAGVDPLWIVPPDETAEEREIREAKIQEILEAERKAKSEAVAKLWSKEGE